jgi:hypothetical protein
MNTDNHSTLSINIRILVGLASLPSIALAVMLGITITQGDYNSISAFEVIYSAVGVLGIYIAITGKKLF